MKARWKICVFFFLRGGCEANGWVVGKVGAFDDVDDVDGLEGSFNPIGTLDMQSK